MSGQKDNQGLSPLLPRGNLPPALRLLLFLLFTTPASPLLLLLMLMLMMLMLMLMVLMLMASPIVGLTSAIAAGQRFFNVFTFVQLF